MSTPTLDRDRLRELAAQGARELASASATDVVDWAVGQFGRRLCVASSMADGVVPHLVSSALPGVDVVFLDTGYHFAETIGTRDALQTTLPITVKNITPPQTVAEQDAEYGPKLHDRDPDLCCQLRKVVPLRTALAGYAAWTTGLRRDEASSRADTAAVEWDASRELVKINPIVEWTQADVDAYIAEHHILVNPLLYDGYGSIGCQPCTQRIVEGADARSGRWAGTAKNECGLHT
ncbi:MAG: phosphoadenylyl-sulfate reductase [Actinobacteria bacterium]|nr:phosphoadenylyl-sulfate reductase [Actinomycetota bacterium]